MFDKSRCRQIRDSASLDDCQLRFVWLAHFLPLFSEKQFTLPTDNTPVELLRKRYHVRESGHGSDGRNFDLIKSAVLSGKIGPPGFHGSPSNLNIPKDPLPVPMATRDNWSFMGDPLQLQLPDKDNAVLFDTRPSFFGNILPQLTGPQRAPKLSIFGSPLEQNVAERLPQLSFHELGVGASTYRLGRTKIRVRPSSLSDSIRFKYVHFDPYNPQTWHLAVKPTGAADAPQPVREVSKPQTPQPTAIHENEKKETLLGMLTRLAATPG